MTEAVSGVLVVVETSRGQARTASLEALGAARELSAGGAVSAVVIGSGVETAGAEVAQRGAAHVLVVDSPLLEHYTTDGYARAIEAAMADTRPRIVVLAGTTSGRDLGPYLAARVGTSCLSDCISARVEGDILTATRPVYQGKMLTDAIVSGPDPTFVVVRGGVIPVPEVTTEGSVRALEVSITPDDLRVTVTGVEQKPTGNVNLEAAEVIVVGGRGVGSAENFGILEDLAAAFNAPVGATRAVTDLGWRPHYEQIGQTGKTVRPKLYIGIGVSGAVQHLVGMQGSETVLVVNRDPDAPLFKLATIGVVGDLNEVVPALTRAVRTARGG